MKSVKIAQIDIDKCVQANRRHGIDKHKRDLIICFLWNKGITTNEKITAFNMSYSAFSHCEPILKRPLSKFALICPISASLMSGIYASLRQSQILIIEILHVFTPRAFTTRHLWLIRLRRIAFLVLDQN